MTPSTVLIQQVIFFALIHIFKPVFDKDSHDTLIRFCFVIGNLIGISRAATNVPSSVLSQIAPSCYTESLSDSVWISIEVKKKNCFVYLIIYIYKQHTSFVEGWIRINVMVQFLLNQVLIKDSVESNMARALGVLGPLCKVIDSVVVNQTKRFFLIKSFNTPHTAHGRRTIIFVLSLITSNDNNVRIPTLFLWSFNALWSNSDHQNPPPNISPILPLFIDILRQSTLYPNLFTIRSVLIGKYWLIAKSLKN